MIPAAFDYARPDALASAIALLQAHGDAARPLAGGHSLLPMMKLRLATPTLLVDIARLPELQGCRVQAGQLSLGAATPHAWLAHDPTLAAAAPLLPRVAAEIGDAAVRARGTLGGALAHADPSADWPAAMLALDATFELAGPEGTRRVPAAQFFLGLFHTALREAELIVRIHIPLAPEARCAWRKFRHPASGYAVAGVAVVLTMQDGRCRQARIGITGVSDHAFRATRAEALLEGLAPGAASPAVPEAVLAAAFDGIAVQSDGFADAAYRLQVARTLLRRALDEALSPPAAAAPPPHG